MPEQVGTPTMHFPDVPWDCGGGNLFWHGCNEFHVYGLYRFQAIDYSMHNLVVCRLCIMVPTCAPSTLV